MTNRASLQIEITQLVISVLIILGSIFYSWMDVNSRIDILETKQNNDEDFKIEVQSYFKELQDGQTKILIELQNKKDRSN